ncbi:MAG TPA: hypothetical protein VHW91_04905 [Candidatus Dormibacteraeota bacterium]|nr:hypothetical protein [Candidatus Dormibacteraeota bacterium]
MSTEQGFNQSVAGFGKLIDQLTPWLLDLGSWIFGALIAFDLLVLSPLLTVGPVDAAVLIGSAAFALALPPAVTGFILLRLLDDITKLRLEDVAAQSFASAGFTVPKQPTPDEMQATMKQRTRTILIYTYATLALNAALMVTGIAGALWHMAWWISVSFIAMVLASIGLVPLAMGGFKTRPDRRSAAS